MFKTCILNLFFPVFGFIVLRALQEANGSIDHGYMNWFYVAGGLQLLGALVLIRNNARLWALGWALLWCSSASFMAGYADLHKQDSVHTDVIGEDSKVRNLKARPAKLNKKLAELPSEASAKERAAIEKKLAELPKKIEEAELGELDEASQTRSGGFAGSVKAYKARYGRDVPADFRETFGAVRDKLTALEYVMALLFLGAFFSVAAFSSLPAQVAYRIEGASTEDPLHLAPMILDKS